MGAGRPPPPGGAGAPPGADGGIVAGVSEQNLQVFAQLVFIASFIEQQSDK